MRFRKKDEMINQNSDQLKLIQSLKDEINNYDLRKKEIEFDVANIMKDFEDTRNKLIKLV